MRIKKYYNNVIVIFETINDNIIIKHESVIFDIVSTFEETALLNKNIEFDKLIKLQQKNPRHILIPYNTKPLDNIRIMLKMLNNFLRVTNQSYDFIIESIIVQNDIEILAYGHEIYLNSIKDITFSPLARSKWSNPQLIAKICNVD